MIFRNPSSALSKTATAQRLAMFSFFQFLTLRHRSLPRENKLSIEFVVEKILRRAGALVSRWRVSVSSIPSRRLFAAEWLMPSR